LLAGGESLLALGERGELGFDLLACLAQAGHELLVAVAIGLQREHDLTALFALGGHLGTQLALLLDEAGHLVTLALGVGPLGDPALLELGQVLLGGLDLAGQPGDALHALAVLGQHRFDVAHRAGELGHVAHVQQLGHHRRAAAVHIGGAAALGERLALPGQLPAGLGQLLLGGHQLRGGRRQTLLGGGQLLFGRGELGLELGELLVELCHAPVQALDVGDGDLQPLLDVVELVEVVLQAGLGAVQLVSVLLDLVGDPLAALLNLLALLGDAGDRRGVALAGAHQRAGQRHGEPRPGAPRPPWSARQAPVAHIRSHGVQACQVPSVRPAHF